MRLVGDPKRKPPAVENGELRLSAFGSGPRRPPSQKELASILHVTTRHLRRWGIEEAKAGRPCSRPYTHADLWRLYQRRGHKGWDRAFAARIGLAEVFERFDQIRVGDSVQGAKDCRSMTAAMMLRSIAEEENEREKWTDSLPQLFAAGLATAAKAQLRVIVDCPQARDVLVKAFFEAALIAEAKRVPSSVEIVALAAQSA